LSPIFFLFLIFNIQPGKSLCLPLFCLNPHLHLAARFSRYSTNGEGLIERVSEQAGGASFRLFLDLHITQAKLLWGHIHLDKVEKHMAAAVLPRKRVQ